MNIHPDNRSDLEWRMGNEIALFENETAQTMLKVAESMLRPSTIYRPTLSIDGNQWCALYGDNLQDGVAGFGNTPELAYADFDKQWVNDDVSGRKRIPAPPAVPVEPETRKHLTDWCKGCSDRKYRTGCSVCISRVLQPTGYQPKEATNENQ